VLPARISDTKPCGRPWLSSRCMRRCSLLIGATPAIQHRQLSPGTTLAACICGTQRALSLADKRSSLLQVICWLKPGQLDTRSDLGCVEDAVGPRTHDSQTETLCSAGELRGPVWLLRRRAIGRTPDGSRASLQCLMMPRWEVALEAFAHPRLSRSGRNEPRMHVDHLRITLHPVLILFEPEPCSCAFNGRLTADERTSAADSFSRTTGNLHTIQQNWKM
jgi:hypothetical protein